MAAYPSFETLRLHRDDRGVATVALDRPKAHNALDDVMIRELTECAMRLADDGEVRVVVLTGEGRTFCAGGDIRWFSRNLDRDRDDRIAQSAALARMLREMDQLPKPLVGRINGPAYGGGVGMIAVCDYSVGRADAHFALTEVRLGLIPANISPYVVARMGAAACRATMLSGARFDAARAVALGLLTEAVAEVAFDERVEAVVTAHLEAAPGAVAQTKRLIEYVASHGIDESMVYTAERLADAWDENEGRTGVRCFLDKQVPPWRSGR